MYFCNHSVTHRFVSSAHGAPQSKGHGTLCGAVRPHHHKYSVSISVHNYRAHWTCRGSALDFFDPTSRLSIRSFTPVWHTDRRHVRHPPEDATSPGRCRRRTSCVPLPMVPQLPKSRSATTQQPLTPQRLRNDLLEIEGNARMISQRRRPMLGPLLRPGHDAVRTSFLCLLRGLVLSGDSAFRAEMPQKLFTPDAVIFARRTRRFFSLRR